MERRIFGLENEYGVTCTFRGQRRLSPDEVARYLFRRVVSWGRSSNVFLKNGARLYLDVGSHPEYATPECDDLVDLVTHDKAGERTLEGLLMDAERRLRVVADDTPSQMCSARWLTQNTAPRGVCSTLPAPQMICRVTRNGISTSASRENSPCRPTR